MAPSRPITASPDADPQIERPGTPSQSYKRTWRRLTPAARPGFYDGLHNTRRNIVNTIIYIVGLIVVIGFILSFFGLR